jgi:hypothetical protein
MSERNERGIGQPEQSNKQNKQNKNKKHSDSPKKLSETVFQHTVVILYNCVPLFVDLFVRDGLHTLLRKKRKEAISML